MGSQTALDTTIRFKNSRTSRIAVVVFVGLGIWASVMLVAHVGITPGAVFFVLLGCFVAVVAANAMIRLSDIVVDANGMRRRLLGHSVGAISWSEVRCVRVLWLWNPSVRKKIRLFKFELARNPIAPFKRYPGFSFWDLMENSTDVIAVLNSHIATHNIRVESGWEDGNVQCSQL